MIKFLSYHETSVIEKVPELQDLAQDKVEIVTSEELNVEDILKMDLNIIEIPLRYFHEFIPHLKFLSIETYDLQLADCIVRKNFQDDYKEISSLAIAIQYAIINRVKNLDTTGRVLICGESEFIMVVARQFYQLGFTQFLLCPSDDGNKDDISKKLKKGNFQIEIQFSKIDELNQISLMSDVMIINIEENQNSEFYEALSYFNYLTRNAIFLDLQDRLYPPLRDEAKRTELQVIDSLDVYRQRYRYLFDLAKNTP